MRHGVHGEIDNNLEFSVFGSFLRTIDIFLFPKSMPKRRGHINQVINYRDKARGQGGEGERAKGGKPKKPFTAGENGQEITNKSCANVVNFNV